MNRNSVCSSFSPIENNFIRHNFGVMLFRLDVGICCLDNYYKRYEIVWLINKIVWYNGAGWLLFNRLLIAYALNAKLQLRSLNLLLEI